MYIYVKIWRGAYVVSYMSRSERTLLAQVRVGVKKLKLEDI